MLGILIIFLLTAASLALLFWLGGMFLQGYLYTQPSENMYWQAPAAAVVLASFITFWCVLIINSAEATPTNIPYDVIHRFSATEEMVTDPVKELRAVPKAGKPVIYKRYRLDQNKYVYLEDTMAKRPWNHDAQAILLTFKDEEYRFEPTPTSRGGTREYVSDKGGWVMKVYGEDGPNGVPEVFRYGRFVANLLLNFVHFALWIVCMWLLLRFLLSHALLLAIGLWLVSTLILLPMLFSYAGKMSQQRRSGQPTPPVSSVGRASQPVQPTCFGISIFTPVAADGRARKPVLRARDVFGCTHRNC